MPPQPKITAGPVSVTPEHAAEGPAALQKPPAAQTLVSMGQSPSALGQSAELNAAIAGQQAAGAPGAPAVDPAQAAAQRQLALMQIPGLAHMVNAHFTTWHTGVNLEHSMVLSLLKDETEAAEAALSKGLDLAHVFLTAAAGVVSGALAGVAAHFLQAGVKLVKGQMFAGTLGGAASAAIGSLGASPALTGEAALNEFVRRALKPAEATVMFTQQWFNMGLLPEVMMASDPAAAVSTLNDMVTVIGKERDAFMQRLRHALLDAFATSKAADATDSHLRAHARKSEVGEAVGLDGLGDAVASRARPEGTVQVDLQLAEAGQAPQVRGVSAPGASPGFQAAFGKRPLAEVNAPVRLVCAPPPLQLAEKAENEGFMAAVGAAACAAFGEAPSTFIAARAPQSKTMGEVGPIDTNAMSHHLGNANPAARQWLASHAVGGAPAAQAAPAQVQAGMRKLFDEVKDAQVP